MRQPRWGILPFSTSCKTSPDYPFLNGCKWWMIYKDARAARAISCSYCTPRPLWIMALSVVTLRVYWALLKGRYWPAWIRLCGPSLSPLTAAAALLGLVEQVCCCIHFKHQECPQGCHYRRVLILPWTHSKNAIMWYLSSWIEMEISFLFCICALVQPLKYPASLMVTNWDCILLEVWSQ